jgi:hypothetical protein
MDIPWTMNRLTTGLQFEKGETGMWISGLVYKWLICKHWKWIVQAALTVTHSALTLLPEKFLLWMESFRIWGKGNICA